MTTAASGPDDQVIPPLFARLVDDTSLLRSRVAAPAVEEIVTRYLVTRDGPYGGVVGQLVCPISRLSNLVGVLAKAAPSRPVDLSLVVDTGLGAVPKALSTALSRTALLTPRTVETAAPPDVDAMWLERVSEFVPDDVVAVVEPRRPVAGGDTSTWLQAVSRVAEHGCTPKLRCGGARGSDVPSVADVAEFLHVVVAAGCGFTALGLRHAVRGTERGVTHHGILNVLAAVARGRAGGDVATALESTEPAELADELNALPEASVDGVRSLLPRCGVDRAPVPAEELAKLGLLT